MLHYIIWTGLIWGILLIPYVIFYRNQSYFVINRIYLLTSLILGLIIPFIPQGDLTIPAIKDTPVQFIAVQLQEITIKSNSVGTHIHVHLFYILYTIYIIAVLISLIQLIKSFQQIRQLIPNLNLLKKEVQIHYSDSIAMPFSFLNTIVLPEQFRYNQHERAVILNHENAHIINKHYLDLFFIQLLLLIFPFHPLIYWYRKELKLVHEFEADRKVLLQYPADQYARLLIQLSNTTHLNPPIIHSFASSHLKIRIMMFTKRYFIQQSMIYFLIPFFFLFCYSCFSQHEKNNPKDEIKTITSIDTMSIFDPKTNIEQLKIVQESIDYHTVPEIMPEFPGGTTELMKYISSKLVYPEQMNKNNKEGTTILTFIINEFGQLKHPTIIKSVTPEFDQAARDCLFNLAQDITWKPGMINGKPVNVIYTLPIKFKLE